MRPVLDQERWEAALAQTHQLSVAGYILDKTTGEEIPIDGISGGAVTLDNRAQIRGQLDAVITNPTDLVPADATDLLTPHGNEVRIERGLQYWDGTVERVSLGIFRIETVGVIEAGNDFQIRLTGFDRSAFLADARFEEPFQIAQGTDLNDALQDLVSIVLPNVTYRYVETGYTTPELFGEEGGDRLAFLSSAANGAGCYLYFDGDGVNVLDTLGQEAIAASSIVEGSGGMLLGAAQYWDREGIYNRVIATGENFGETAPARGVATNDDPNSPLNYDGPFGHVPRFYTSQFIKDDDQAQDAAEAILATQKGASRKVDFTSLVNPALEPGDTITIECARALISGDHTIDMLRIPLSASESMSGSCRYLNPEEEPGG